MWSILISIFVFSFKLLPILTKSKNVRQNYPSSFIDDDDENAQSPFLDQVAQADTWNSQSNRVISATYTGDPQTGESKLIIFVFGENSLFSNRACIWFIWMIW